jgi:hypothetical protein
MRNNLCATFYLGLKMDEEVAPDQTEAQPKVNKEKDGAKKTKAIIPFEKMSFPNKFATFNGVMK